MRVNRLRCVGESDTGRTSQEANQPKGEMGHRMPPIALSPDQPPLPYQQNLGHNWL